MRSHSTPRYSVIAALAALALLLLIVPRAQAQDRDDGLQPGDYIRVGVGAVSPLSPQGSLRDWGKGQTLNVVWDTWGPAASGGVDLIGYGIGVGYTLLPLREGVFVSGFVPTQVDGSTESATASKAGVFEVSTNLRIRIPSPFMMPYATIGFGFMNWHPGTIHYTTTTGDTGDAKQQSRSGAEFQFGVGLEKQIYDRFGIFGEGLYTYGLTSFGGGIATTSGSCIAAGCDAIRNTTLGTVRAGLRLRIGQ